MKTISVAKGEVLQKAGSPKTNIYYVKSGLLRSYTIDKKGKEHIFMFGPEGWIVADSIAENKPSVLYIDAIEASEVLVREKPNIIELRDPYPLLKRISVLQERILMLMSSSAIERYQHFVRSYHGISQRVTQRMIASYLGITPEALSKVKKEHLKSSSEDPSFLNLD